MRISDWSSDVCSSDLRSTSDCEHARRRTAAKGLAIAPRRSGDERGRESVAVRFATAEETARSPARVNDRSEEHTSELQSLMRISYAVFCLKKKNNKRQVLYTPSTK